MAGAFSLYGLKEKTIILFEEDGLSLNGVATESFYKPLIFLRNYKVNIHNGKSPLDWQVSRRFTQISKWLLR